MSTMKKAKAPEAAMDTFMTLLQRHRIARGLTQAGLAIKLNVDASTVCLWESGATAPSPKRVKKLARILGVSAMKVTELIEQSEPASAK
jgi:ribosome-binding protein aMBF1 (putative translation factor)